MKYTTKNSCHLPNLKMIAEESRLNLVHQNLRNVPKTLINSYQASIKIIDISNNNINDVSFLGSFTNLTCIILDHNDLTSSTVFPVLTSVKILWANHNQIRSMRDFIDSLSRSFPSLQQLSLMGNPGVPLCHEDTYYDYIRYRLYVISCFEELKHLDDNLVTEHEREEAHRLFGSPPLFDKLSSITDVFSGAFSKVRQYISTSASDHPSII